MPADDTPALRPAWLSHHHAGEADRCVFVGRVPVCRRCLAMFAGFIPALWLLSGSFEPQEADIAVVLGFVAYAAYDFIQVVRGEMAYRARRVLLVMPFVGVLEAHLAVSGVRDGLGPTHLILGLAALGVLGVLVANSTLVRRAAPLR